MLLYAPTRSFAFLSSNNVLILCLKKEEGYFAGNAVAQAAVPGGVGLTRGQALAAITRNPARIFGLTDLGTLETGKRGDVIVWDGDPLELTSAPTAVFIDGVAQPMVSRQTLLRDRYRDLARGALPLQYPQGAPN